MLRKIPSRVAVLLIALSFFATAALASPSQTYPRLSWSNPSDRAELGRIMLEQETSLAQQLQGTFSELNGLTYYPFFQKWRANQLNDSIDRFFLVYATPASGYLSIGDTKPMTFLSPAGNEAVVAIKKASGKVILVFGSKKDDTWVRTQAIEK